MILLISVGPNDSFEWGDLSFSELKEYQYQTIQWDIQQSASYTSKLLMGSTLMTTLNVNETHQNSTDISTKHQQKKMKMKKKHPILMLGCGNSRLGEEMIKKGMFQGPIIQVDVSRPVIESMQQRCSHLISKGVMSLVQDDATELSAFRNNMIDACLDKGLIDAIFCAEDYNQLYSIQRNIYRVLRPGGTFVFFSYSRPEFLIPKLILHEQSISVKIPRSTVPWTNIEVQQLPNILLYKLRKNGD